MDASRLSYSQRQAVLHKLREQLGNYDYERMVDQLGEDGLIDAALAQAVRATQVSRKFESPPTLWDWIGTILNFIYCIGFAIFWIVMITRAFIEDWKGALLFFGAILLCWVIWRAAFVPLWERFTRR